MRKFALTIAAASVIVAAGSLLAPRAQAMTAPAPAGLGAAIDESRLTEDVAYVCRRWWNGYRWVRSCRYRPSYYGYRPYRHRYRYYRRW
jgi:hypothetical protein